MRKIWLKDVARAAGVSVSAASHAVNGTGTLAAATRARILKQVEALGYRRDPVLSGIAARRFQGDTKEHFYPVGLLTFARKEARLFAVSELPRETAHELGQAYGFQILSKQILSTVEEAQRVLEQLRARGVEVILIGSVERDWPLHELDFSAFCVLGIQDIDGPFPFHKVERDWGNAVRLCYDALWEAGCRRIGLQSFGGDGLTYQDRVRLGAYLSEVAARAEAAQLPPLLLREGMDMNRATLEWVRKERPEGLIGWPAQTIHFLRENGVQIPEDLQVTLLNCPAGDSWTMPFAGIETDARQETAYKLQVAYELLTHRDKGVPALPVTHRFRCPFRAGPSLAS